MPDKRTIEKAREDKREGKSASTQAGEFVRAEIDKIRHGEHGARSARQAIAIGLSEARRAPASTLPPPRQGGKTSARTRRSAKYAYDVGQGKRKAKRRPRVSRAVENVLEREPRNTVSRQALSRQGKRAASRRTAAQRSAAAKKGARTRAQRRG